MANWQRAEIVDAVPATPRIRLFRLRPATWAPFVAGQHLDVRLTAPDGYQAERSYSVSSAPEDAGRYELAVELMPDGEVSPYFHEVAAPGDSFEIRGPFGGHFAWAAADGGPLLLVGGGSGIAPLMSILRHRAAAAPEVAAALLYAARTWEDLVFRDELVARDRDEPALAVAFALSRDTARRPQDHARRLDAAALAAGLDMLPGPPATTFICGNNGFVETVATHAIALGLPAATIRTERFGGA
jgi:ferredoxin-NADP reductase